jgi:TonB-linked SusC/RagA family outer membrane protein
MYLSKKLLLIGSCLLFFHLLAGAQTQTVTGKVSDADGNPLPGTTVQVRGSTRTVVTGADGSFSIETDANTKALVFSHVGMQTQEVPVSGKNSLTVRLKTAATEMNDVVVVGYGSQRRADLTGSVATVTGAELAKRPATDAANLLQGKVAGLNIVQGTGQPGHDAPNIQIRGLGSFGASPTPLILIDGVQGDLNTISPDDIASVSVLKDAASASIYGSLAANGVILVTTKRGHGGAFSVDYSSIFGVDRATRLPSLVYNSAQYMTMYNQAREHSGLTDIYTPDQINAYKNAPANSIQYPNFNWTNYMFGNASRQSHHIGLSGGNEKTAYNLAVSYLDQGGIVTGHHYDRWNTLFNLDSKLNPIFKVGMTTAFNYQYIRQPWLTNDNLVLIIYHAAPTYMPYLPDGSGRLSNGDYPTAYPSQRSPVTVATNGGDASNYYEARSQAYVEATILKGLTWMAKVAINYNDHFDKILNYPVNEYLYQKPAGAADYAVIDNSYPSSPGVTDQDYRETLLTAYSTLNYDKTFTGGHSLKVMAGYEQKNDRIDQLQGNRLSVPSSVLTELYAGAASGQTNYGAASEWALRSFFGRANYNYLDKYLLEANFRYDGSSRLSPQGRWGLFPSVSAGWVMSRENFMKNISWLSEFKLRGSLGTLGNQLIGNYPYQSLYNIVNYPFASLEQGAQASALVDPNIKWEKTHILDFGTDINIKNGLFTATVDWYRKKTDGILAQLTVPQSVGLTGPVTNYGSMENIGWDVGLGHNNSIGKDFHYGINILFSTYQNKVLQLSGGTQDNGATINQAGLPYKSFYLLQWGGIFQSQAEIDAYAKQPFTPKPGDPKYLDVSGPNGKPDGFVNSHDRVVTKGAYPAYTYSFNLNVSYKNWSLTAFFLGVQGAKSYVSGWGVDPFAQGAPPPTYFENAWTPQNHSQSVPALYTNGYSPVDGVASTYFLQDASYFRLKNLYLGYRLPKGLTGKVGLKQVTVYASADNLLTSTKYRGADPESAVVGGFGNFAQYPQLRTLSGGINLNF